MADKYIILNNGKIKLSDIINDCSDLCVPTKKNEPLLVTLDKICKKIESIKQQPLPTIEETDPIFSSSPAFTIGYTDIGHWQEAYNNQIISASFTGTTTKTLTLIQQDGGTITAPFTDLLYTDEMVDDRVSNLLVAGTAISLNYNDIANTLTISNTSPDQLVTLTAGSNITITGTYPNFTITAAGASVGTDELVKVSANDTTPGYLNGKLVIGTGITFTENNNGANETLTIAHSDTSSVVNLDTSGAQVIDTLTFDTFGHVQTVTTRNLTLSDLGYVVPSDTNWANTNLTLTGNRTHNIGSFQIEYDFADDGYMLWYGGNTSQGMEQAFQTANFTGGMTNYADIGTGWWSGYSQGGFGNQYISMQSTSTKQIAQIGNYRNEAGQWTDQKMEWQNTGDPTSTYWRMHNEKWIGTGPYTASHIFFNDTGILLQTKTTIGAGGLDYKGIIINSSSDIQFDNYPNTRDDGDTAKALFISNSAGDIKYGDIILTSSSISDFNEAVDDRVDALIIDGTGITTSYNDGAGTLTITNSAPDQTVVLSNGAGISVTGTYPNFTIASTITQYTDELAQDAIFNAVLDGTGISTSYNDIANTFTITNSAPDQTVVLNNGAGITVTGTYPTFTIASTITQYTDELAQDAVAAAIAAGSHTGISVSYNDVANSISFTNTDLGSSQNIFKNIAVSGQNTVIADSNNDTLTLVAGTGVTITTDDTTDSITINSTASGFTNLTQFVSQTAWRIFYSDGSGDVQELALGANGEYLQSTGATGVPTWSTPAGSGTVNTGAALKAAYYPSAGTTVDDWIGVEFNNTGLNTKIIQQATTDVALELKGIAAQTGNFLNVSSSAGTGDLMKITKDGYIVVPAGSSASVAGSIQFPLLSLSSSYQLNIWNASNGFTAAIGNAGLFLKNTTDAVRFGNGSLFGNAERLAFSSPATNTAEFGTATPANTIIKINNNSGTDVTGFNLDIQSGAGTGNSTLGGNIYLSTSDATGPGATVQSYTPKLTITKAGNVTADGYIFYVDAVNDRIRLAGDVAGNLPVQLGAIGAGSFSLTTATLGVGTPVGGSGPAYIVTKHGATGPEAYFGSESALGLFGTFTNHPLVIRSNNVTWAQLNTTGEFSLGVAGTRIGKLQLSGNTSGTITVAPQAAAGTFNFNLPTTAGTSGYLLTSGGGGAAAMTWTNPATLGGGGGYTVHEIDNTDSPYTISETSGEVVILVDASAGAVTVNLPTAVGNTAKYNIKLVADGNTLTITPDGAETIDGSATVPITVENVAVTLINNNTNWFII